jgi:hypothetical protein
MEGKHDMWSPWYLMPKDKSKKVECKFYNNVISYHKDRMLLHLGYQYDVNKQIQVVVCWKALFAPCGGLVPPPLNDMELLAHILNGWTKDVGIKTPNPLLEGEYVLMFQMEMAWNFTPPPIQKV